MNKNYFKVEKETRDFIDSIVFQLRTILKYENIYELDMEKVIQDLKGEIKYVDTYGDSIIERIEKNNTFKITMNYENDKRERNYKIAYDLGYIFLYMGYLIDIDIWKNEDNYYIRNNRRIFRKNASYKVNSIVHQFAITFLMPFRELCNTMNDTYDKTGYYQMGEISELFNVEYEYVIERAVQIHKISI